MTDTAQEVDTPDLAPAWLDSPSPVDEETEPALELVEDDLPDSDDEDDSRGADSPDRSAAHRAGMERARVRKIVTKTVEVVNADKAARVSLASLLAVDNDDVALTTAILTADRAALSDLDLLERAIDSDTIGVAALVMQLVMEDRATMRSLWSLAAQFGAKLPAKPPAQPMKIVDALARGIQGMGADAAGRINAVRTLAKKG